MNPGRFDRLVTIEAFTTTQSPSGFLTETWTTFATTWAQFIQESGKEFFANDQTVAERKAVFRMNWLDGVTVQHRVTYDGETWDIHEVRELGRRAGLELHCTATE